MTVAGDGPRPHRLPHQPGCGCQLCWLAARARGEKRPRHKRRPRPPAIVIVRPRCPFEGDVLEECLTCKGEKAENRHVRRCDHPAAEWDRCRRGATADPAEVQSCAACPLHPAA